MNTCLSLTVSVCECVCSLYLKIISPVVSIIMDTKDINNNDIGGQENKMMSNSDNGNTDKTAAVQGNQVQEQAEICFEIESFGKSREYFWIILN